MGDELLGSHTKDGMQQTVRAAFRPRPAAGRIAPRPLACIPTDILGHLWAYKRTTSICQPTNRLVLPSVCRAGGRTGIGRVLGGGERKLRATAAEERGAGTRLPRSSVEYCRLRLCRGQQLCRSVREAEGPTDLCSEYYPPAESQR